MSGSSSILTSSTRPVPPQVAAVLARVKPGQRVRVTQTVRVGQEQWTTATTGTYRDVRYLATGLATHRVAEDDIIVPTVHFTKDNGELSSIALDENSRIEIVSSP